MSTHHIRSVALRLALGVIPFTVAHGEEGGSGHYFPGSMSSFVDGVPPDETFIARYNFAYYDGDHDAALPIAGLPIAGNVNAESFVNGLTFLWRPPLDLGERWSYAMSATIPYISLDVSADVMPTAGGPTIHRSDSIDGIGDIVLMPLMLNYKVNPDFNINARLGIYAPTGSYKVGRLANAGKNFWTFEPKIGFMYFGQKNGREASLLTGFDFNTENDDTNYQSGTQWVADGTLAQHFPLWGGLAGVGITGYWYEQIEGDSGSGATFGDFEGRTAGLGPVLSYSGKIRDTAVTAEIKWLHEFETKNRLEGDYFWAKLVFKF